MFGQALQLCLCYISLVRVSFRCLASWSRELQESGRCCVPYSITELSFGPGLENLSMRSSSTGAVEAQVFRALECCTSWCSRRSALAFHVDQIAKVDRKNAFHQLRRTTYKNASTAGSATDLLLSSSKGRFLPCKSQCKSMRSFGSTKGSSYITLAEPVLQHTVEIKRSKFIASAAPVDDEGAALAFLSQVQKSNASHNCWAFKIGDHARCSDDGEPGGTAGRPMLSALTSSGLDHIMVVVTRYFGGIKLGTGGLVRAYGKVTTECLKDARTITIKPKVSVQLRVPFDVLGVLYPLLQVYNVEKVQERFDSNGDAGVCMDLLVELDKLENLERDVGVNSKGRASFIRLNLPSM
ncbi:hypothetical protein CY35_17G031900 [Sphagnum magellanicum]|nr:hypothetical protein CY35_17G031900 [Sphagnum magellanicum]